MRHEEGVFAVLMGSNRNCITIWIMFCVFSWFNVQASSQSNPLNSFLYDYAFKAMHRPRTGKLYEVIPPVNLSGIEVSIIRLRTHRLWRNGANFSAVEIPAKILPSPFTKRVDIVYQNLGNWSSSYYNVPNYTLVTPVIGLLAYDSTINHRLVELNTRGGNPMIVRFENVSGDARMKCVRFSLDGTMELSNVTAKSSCETRREGHFSIVVPRKSKKSRVFKWWMVGIPAGVVGFIMVLIVGILGFMFFDWRRLNKMVTKSEKGETLDTIWVGNSRMPSASGIRTQPILETTYLP